MDLGRFRGWSWETARSQPAPIRCLFSHWSDGCVCDGVHWSFVMKKSKIASEAVPFLLVENSSGSGQECPLYTRLFFHGLRIQFLFGFASGQALGDDQAPGFDAQCGQGSSEPDRADYTRHASYRYGDGRAYAVG